jgi:hypothetical protein
MLTDKEIIQKIQYLRTIQPNSNWVNSLHQTLRQEMRKTAQKQSSVASVFPVFGRMFRPVPIFATVGVLGIIAIFVITGVLPQPSGGPGITENGQNEDQTALVEGNGASESGEKNVSVVVDIDKKNVGSSARTIVLSQEDGQFEQELFNKVLEKLKKAEEMVSEISTVSDVRQTKELLDKAKEALSNGNLVDAFDVLVALERLLEKGF